MQNVDGSKCVDDINEVWLKSSEILKEKLKPQIYSAFIKPLSISKSKNNSLNSFEIITPNKFYREHLEKNYHEIISKVISDVRGESNFSLTFKIKEQQEGDSNNKRVSYSRTTKIKKNFNKLNTSNNNRKPVNFTKDNSNLNNDYNFSNYIIGSCNQFAHAASLKVSENPGKTYNPLFIYGGVGLGKTHLVNAIGNASKRRGKKVLLVSSEVFVNELIDSLRTKNMQQFKNKFRSIDLLIIDDVQFISGKERTQEEFFHTFNDLHQRSKQIVITSDRIPKDLTGLEERLKTRFSSGLLADLQTPDFETRVAILNKKAEKLDILIPQEVSNFLAEKIDTNIRELEGALNRIQAMSSLSNSPVSIDLAKSAISSLIPIKKSSEITIESIQQAVASNFNVSISDLLGKRRTQNIAQARHVAMYLCRKLTGRSFPEIGAVFGGRDHSTAIHACKKLEESLIENKNLRHKISSIENSI